MFVRIKKVGSTRYVYVVKGTRKGRHGERKSVGHLGPIQKLVYGVPAATRRRVRKMFRVDWNEIEDSVAKIPLSFEELSEARHTEYFISNRKIQRRFRAQSARPRTAGELARMSKMIARKFNEMFEEIGEREYRMR